MRSHNPVFNNNEAFARGGYATFNTAPSADQLQHMYDAPPATPIQTGRMTLDDVVMKTAAMFAVLLVAAGVAWYLTPRGFGFLPFAGMIGGLVLGLVIAFKQSTNPALHLTYAVLEGLFVGGISYVLQSYATANGGGNIVAQAIIGTLAAFAAMLVLYRTGVIRATGRFKKIMFIALASYALIALASFVGALFGLNGGWGFYGAGGLGILLCVAGVALASLSLVLDFDMIENGVRAGVPERYSWLAAFGLVVTLVWLYIELLRLLAILTGRED